jgi:hypothetical protein
MSREAMQMALEALELYQSKSSVQMFDDAVKALRQALETGRQWVGLHGSEVPDPYKYDVMFNEGWWWAEEKLKEKDT